MILPMGIPPPICVYRGLLIERCPLLLYLRFEFFHIFEFTFFTDIMHEFNDDPLAIDVGVEIKDVHFQGLLLTIMESGTVPDVHHAVEEFVA